MVILKFCVARCSTFKPMLIFCSPLAEQLWQMIAPSVLFMYKVSLQSKKVMERIRVDWIEWMHEGNDVGYTRLLASIVKITAISTAFYLFIYWAEHE